MGTTRLTLRQKLAEETGLGILGTASGNGTTTTVIDGTNLAGPHSATRWPRGTAIRFSTLNSVAATTNTYVDSYAPATGTITLSPAITATKTADVFEIWSAVETVDRVDEAIDRALTRHCFRWVPVPLTKVTDGDMGDSAVTNLWTQGATCTPTKVASSFPNGLSFRSLCTTNTGAAGYVYSNTMQCVPDDTWRVSILVRTTTSADVADFAAYDVTNSTEITLDGGGDGNTYAGREWKVLDNTFTVPSTCYEWRLHLGGQGAADVCYWTHIIANPVHERQFMLPARILADSRVGDVMYRLGDEVDHFRFAPYAQAGNHVSIQKESYGVMVRLDRPMGTGNPVYVEELAAYEALSADTSTTECPEELALVAIEYETYKHLAGKTFALSTPQGYLTPSEWRLRRDEALRRMQRKQLVYGAASKVVFR